jgi:hypothetical protein
VVTPLLSQINLNNVHAKVFKIFCYFASFCYQDLPIPFVSKVKKTDKVNMLYADKTTLIKVEFFMYLDKPGPSSPDTLQSSRMDEQRSGSSAIQADALP